HAQTRSRLGDDRIARGEGDPHMLWSVCAVEVTRARHDADIGKLADGLPRISSARGPKIEPGFAALDSKPRSLQRGAQRLASCSISLALSVDVRIVCKGRDHRVLYRARHHEPRMLAHGEQPRDEV